MTFKIHPFFTENYNIEFAGVDATGNPGKKVNWHWINCGHAWWKNKVFLVPLNEWDLRKVVNDAQRLSEFDDFATHLFELICSHIKDEHNKRKESGHGAITQMSLLIDVKNYSYMQLINFGGKNILDFIECWMCLSYDRSTCSQRSKRYYN